MQTIVELTLTDWHNCLNTKTCSVRELVAAYLERIRNKDQFLHAIVSYNQTVLAQAERLDQSLQHGAAPGLLYGVPILVKDNIETALLPTTAGSISLAGYYPPSDAAIVKRLQQAGAIILGKTNLHEFAIWGETISSIGGQTINPYDYTRSPGGSSGGTGAGVAANFCLAGIGTDTVNSVRSPASANCLVGVRPTMGLISCAGVVPYSATQDTVGPLTRTVRDAALVLQVLAGAEGNGPDYSAGLTLTALSGRRLGVLTNFFGREPVHQPVNQVMATAFTTLAEQGAELIELELEWEPEWLVTEVSVHQYELYSQLNTYLQTTSPPRSIAEILAARQHHPGIKHALEQATTLATDQAGYTKRLEQRQLIIKRLLTLFAEQRLDALVFPHQQRLVASIGQPQLERNGVLAAIAGLPAITVPAGFSQATPQAPLGVPVGLELVGRPYSEAQLLAMAYDFEQAKPVRLPPAL